MRPGLRCGMLLAVLLLPSLLSLAASHELLFELDVAQLEREGLQASAVHVRLHGPGDGGAPSLEADIGRLDVAELPGPLQGVRLSCPAATLAWPAVDCEQALLEVQDSPWGPQEIGVALAWRSASDWELRFNDLRYAGGSISGKLVMQGGQWRLDADGAALHAHQVEPLQQLRSEHGLASLQGMLGAQLRLTGDAAGVRELDLQGTVRNLAWADEAGLQAAQALRASYALSATAQDGDWRGRLKLDLQEGELYSDPVFLDLRAQPLALDVRGRWLEQRQRLQLDRLSLDAGEGLQLDGEMVLDTAVGQLLEGTLDVDAPDLSWSSANLLQPLLIGTALADMQVAGSARARLHWREKQLHSLDVHVNRLDMDDPDAFGANAVSGDFYWRAQEESPASRIAFQGGHVGKLLFGAGALDFRAGGPVVYLLAPVVLPFYEGEIEIPELSWVATEEGYDAGFSAAVRDVSLGELSLALGWPEMTGRIEGTLPRARLTPGRLAVAGDIEVRAFDGRMWLRGLSLDQLGSAAPVLQAEFELRRLDLAKLTETFSFGRIRGRLDGEVRNLQLVAWEPNRFDAHFYSPQDDDLPHRISQRAVQDLTELGNGVSGVLSAPLFRFFEEFSYDRVELKVRQRGERAEISGIPHRDGGFYLVKGAGIPRIDVIGRNRQVAWNDLVERLRSIRFDGVAVE